MLQNGLILALLFSIGAFGQVTRDLTYNGLSGEISGTCSVPYKIHGLVPPGRRRPVALYVPGTNEPFESRAGNAFIERMAALGFAAFVIEYPNRTDGGCTALANKAACMFGSTRGTALRNIAAEVPRADLSRIVVAGISQGAQLAVMSANGRASFKAAWAIGVGNILSLGPQALPMQTCMNSGRHTLGPTQIWAANAGDDQFFDVPTVREELQGVSGNADCSAAFHSSNGSGCETIPVSAFVAGSGHAYPFSDYQHWSTDPMIDWGLMHVSQWLCDMVACSPQGGRGRP
jgi:hypothetical protein